MFHVAWHPTNNVMTTPLHRGTAYSHLSEPLTKQKVQHILSVQSAQIQSRVLLGWLARNDFEGNPPHNHHRNEAKRADTMTRHTTSCLFQSADCWATMSTAPTTAIGKGKPGLGKILMSKLTQQTLASDFRTSARYASLDTTQRLLTGHAEHQINPAGAVESIRWSHHSGSRSFP